MNKEKNEQREEGAKRRMNKEKNEQREEWIIIDRMKFFFDTKKIIIYNEFFTVHLNKTHIKLIGSNPRKRLFIIPLIFWVWDILVRLITAFVKKNPIR